ncbi:MAG: hypothetical protein EAZ91_24975 [Cytophagales bacterium]|nr:MAG: hypothetical protein EAZ91_24975 [Cytophagales bacterium]
METIEKMLVATNNERVVARYRAFLKRRQEVMAMNIADSEHEKRAAEATERLLKENKEKGTFVTAIQPQPGRDEPSIQVHYRFERIV